MNHTEDVIIKKQDIFVLEAVISALVIITRVDYSFDTWAGAINKGKIGEKLVSHNDFISAIGHEATAELLSEILSVEVPFNRVQFQEVLV